jgi:hypothetical protein
MRPVADLLLTDHAVGGALVAFNSPTAMESQVSSWMETNNGDSRPHIRRSVDPTGVVLMTAKTWERIGDAPRSSRARLVTPTGQKPPCDNEGQMPRWPMLAIASMATASTPSRPADGSEASSHGRPNQW